MKGMQRAFYVLAGIAGVLLLSYYGATSVGSKPYDPSLMASWVQAVGSIAAIVGAIWVAFRQDFKEQDARRQAAVITASGMIFRLQDNLDDLDSLIKEFEKMSKIDFNPMNLHRFADRLSELRKWSSDEEVTLIALGEIVRLISLRHVIAFMLRPKSFTIFLLVMALLIIEDA